MLWLVGLPLHYEYDPHKANKQIVALGESNGREDGEVLLYSLSDSLDGFVADAVLDALREV